MIIRSIRIPKCKFHCSTNNQILSTTMVVVLLFFNKRTRNYLFCRALSILLLNGKQTSLCLSFFHVRCGILRFIAILQLEKIHFDNKSIQDVRNTVSLFQQFASKHFCKQAFIALQMIVLRLNYLGQMGVQTMR